MATHDLNIVKGKTYPRVLRWEAPPIIYKPITAITQAAPAVVTCTAHGVPDGWRVAVVSVKGMTQINAENDPPRTTDYTTATVTGVNTLELNKINAANFSAYRSGGYIQYNTPVNLSGMTARMSIKDKVGGTELYRLDTTNGRIVIDNVAKTITFTIPADATAAFTFTKAVYDLEIVSGTVVTLLLYGNVIVTDEVTTT